MVIDIDRLSYKTSFKLGIKVEKRSGDGNILIPEKIIITGGFVIIELHARGVESKTLFYQQSLGSNNYYIILIVITSTMGSNQNRDASTPTHVVLQGVS